MNNSKYHVHLLADEFAALSKTLYFYKISRQNSSTSFSQKIIYKFWFVVYFQIIIPLRIKDWVTMRYNIVIDNILF